MARFKKKHEMTKTDIARIFLSQMDGDDKQNGNGIGSLSGEVSPGLGPVASPQQYGGFHVGDIFTGAPTVSSRSGRILDSMFGDSGIDRISSSQEDAIERWTGGFEQEGNNFQTDDDTFDTQLYDLGSLWGTYNQGVSQPPLHRMVEQRMAENARRQRYEDQRFDDLGGADPFDFQGGFTGASGESSHGKRYASWRSGQQQQAAEAQGAIDDQRRVARGRAARANPNRTDQFGAAWGTQDLFETFNSPEMSIDSARASLPGNLTTRRAEDARDVLDYRSTGYSQGASGISSQRSMEIKDKARAGEDKETKDRYNRALLLYDRFGTQLRAEKDPRLRKELIKQRNEQLTIGKETAQTLGLEGEPGKFPNVEFVGTGDLIKTAGAKTMDDLSALESSMGKGMGAIGLKRGELFKGTGYATTGAINGVMRALAGIFILFVFIGVFYMVFGPIYDSLIYNFTLIVSADGDPTLGGKDIPTLFDNVAKVILVWVPLIVFAGAIYKLTALVFEREGGNRSTEETEWDMLGSIEDSTDLDMGSDPGVFEAYGGGY